MEAYASLTMPWTLLEQTRISASFSRAAARNVQHLPPLLWHDTITSKMRVVFKSYDFADHMSLYLIIEAMEMLAARQDIVSFAFNVRSDDGSDLVRRLRQGEQSSSRMIVIRSLLVLHLQMWFYCCSSSSINIVNRLMLCRLEQACMDNVLANRLKGLRVGHLVRLWMMTHSWGF
jgi:hypothetical protein